MIVYVTYRGAMFTIGTPVPYPHGYTVRDAERGNLSFRRLEYNAGSGCTLEELL